MYFGPAARQKNEIGMMTAPALAGWLAKAIADGVEVPELANLRMGRFGLPAGAG